MQPHQLQHRVARRIGNRPDAEPWGVLRLFQRQRYAGHDAVEWNHHFQPGLYIITGGADWQRVTLNGSGVTFFFTNVSGTSKYGSILITNLSNVNASAASGGTFGSHATGGALSGILFFLSRSWVNTTAQDFNLNSSSFSANGVWYLPDTGIQMYNGSSTCSSYCGVVADNITFYNWEMNVNNENFSAFTNGNPFNHGSVMVQ